ncbi:MAG TPA: type III-B CRISPR module RAMP protein Cmr6 [Thermotogota bacterium]|nr:type III-B CRISPR module RAMP protein Cmr6 [Thermotogota bacterium]
MSDLKIDRDYFLNKTGKNNSLYYNRFAFAQMSDDNKDLASSLLREINRVPTEVSFFDRLMKRRDLTAKQFKERNGYSVIDFNAKSKSRFLLGIGSPSPTEVGFHFSRNYGLPVIPGTSLKGAFQHFLADEEYEIAARNKWFGVGTDDDDMDGERGSIVFLDGLPVGHVGYELDIVNNHFPDYYGDVPDSPPNDWYNPIPVRYMAVSPGATIRFTLLLKGETGKVKEEIKKQFKAMLEHWGVGAKTAYGYGRFRFIDDN